MSDPMLAPAGDTPWRLVLADKSVRCARVFDGTRVVLDGAGETFVAWDAGDPEALERYLLATAARLGWRVREVVPPGERTREEIERRLRMVTGERDGAARVNRLLLERAEKASAILAGSTALPTEHEIAAVASAGGYWYTAFRGRCGVHSAEGVRGHVSGARMGWWWADEARWWPCVGGAIVARPAPSLAVVAAAEEPRCGTCGNVPGEGSPWCAPCRQG